MWSDLTTTADGDTRPVRQIDHDDGSTTIVVDLGAGASDVHTDIVDDTLIVVLDRPHRPEESYELDLPAGEARTFMQNGVLTIEVEE